MGRTGFQFGKRSGSQLPTSSYQEFGVNENSTFLIRRTIDNTEQVFNYSDIIDGSYDTFIIGGQGAIKEWIIGSNKFVQNIDSLQPFLVSNSGNPYVDDTTQAQNMSMSINDIDLSADWVITCVLEEEKNGNNGRMNFSMSDSAENNVVVQLSPYSNNFIYIDQPIGGGISDGYYFSNVNKTLWRLLTFSRIGGVLNVQTSNVDTAFGAITYNSFNGFPAGTIAFGDRGDNSAGKINKYKHFGLVTGLDLSGFDISEHNNSIITKYNI
jgi:hypothetical protein